MPRFLIEVPHDASKEACELAIKAFGAAGSHFLTKADWGCVDDEHKAWLVVDLESKEQARSILPSLFRDKARIVALKQYSYENVQENADKHPH